MVPELSQELGIWAGERGTPWGGEQAGALATSPKVVTLSPSPFLCKVSCDRDNTVLWFTKASLFYTGGNKDPERSSILPKVTQPEGSELGLKPLSPDSRAGCASVVWGFLPHLTPTSLPALRMHSEWKAHSPLGMT